MLSESVIELPVGSVSFEMLPYESHIENVLSANHRNKIEYYKSMIDIEGIKILRADGKISYDFFMGRNIFIDDITSKFKNRSCLNSKESLIHFLYSSLMAGEYCYLALDSSKIEQYINYKKNPMIHSPLVSGIDFKNNRLKLCDFFDFKHYTCKWVSLDKFLSAFFSVQEIISEYKIDKNEKWILSIENISISSEIKNYDKNLNNVIEDYLEGGVIKLDEVDAFDYINSKLTQKDSTNKMAARKVARVKGITTYRYIKNCINRMKVEEYSSLDKKSLAILYKHFLVLKKILIINNNSLHEKEIQQALLLSQNFLLMGVKAQQTGNKDLYNKMLNIIEILEKIDFEILDSMLKRKENNK